MSANTTNLTIANATKAIIKPAYVAPTDMGEEIFSLFIVILFSCLGGLLI